MQNKLLRISVLIFGLSAGILFPKSIMAESGDKKESYCGEWDGKAVYTTENEECEKKFGRESIMTKTPIILGRKTFPTYIIIASTCPI